MSNELETTRKTFYRRNKKQQAKELIEIYYDTALSPSLSFFLYFWVMVKG